MKGVCYRHDLLELVVFVLEMVEQIHVSTLCWYEFPTKQMTDVGFTYDLLLKYFQMTAELLLTLFGHACSAFMHKLDLHITTCIRMCHHITISPVLQGGIMIYFG